MKLLDQVRDEIREKHYSIRTEQAYFEGTPGFKPVMGSVTMPNVLVQSRTIEPAKENLKSW